MSSLPLTHSTVAIPAEMRIAPSIAGLTRLLAKGDEAAFREFHERYFDRLYCFLLVISRGCEDEAQEALQQTMLRVVRYARPFSSEEVFWSWLKALARSAARDAGRHRQRYAALLERFSFFRQRQAQLEPTGQEQDFSILLKDCLAELEPGDRQLLCGKYFDGDTVREIAERLGITEKAVEGRLSRVREQLRNRLLQKLSTT